MVTEKDIEEQLEKLRAANTWQEKRNAIVTLEMWGVNDPIVIQPLVEAALKGSHRILRRTAVRVLGEIGGAEVVEPLIVVLLKSPTPDVRRAAAEALGKMREAKAVGYLVAVLRDVNEVMAVREGAAEALGKIGDSKAVKPLSIVLGDDNEAQPLRQKVAAALGKIATEEAMTTLIAALDGSVEEKSSEILRGIGKPVAMPLIAALSGNNEAIMWKAAALLGEIGDKGAVESLIALLLDESRDEYDRGYYVAPALGKIGDVRAVEQLIKLASKHSEDMLTGMSVRALGDIGNHRAVDSIIAILEDRATLDGLHSHLRLEACRALGKLRDARALESLARIVDGRTREDWGIREAAALALVELDDDRIELPLLKYYQASSKDEVLRKLITRLICKSKDV